MKRRFYRKLSLLLCSLLLFLSFPIVYVHASNVQNDSSPIFGLTADDVVAKYNQLSDQQKVQVLRSLGNTSIFANSLFGNIFNSTFGALDDAVEKIGDLFFQANGVIYKLGSSALSWISRLIDKVFNNDLNDLNISQPVVDDLYKYTRDAVYISTPFFVQPNYTSFLPSYVWGYVSPFPLNCDFVYCFPAGFWSATDPSLCAFNLASNKWGFNFGLICNTDSSEIFFGTIDFSTDNLGNSFYISSSKRFMWDYKVDVPSSPQSLSWSYQEDSYLNVNWHVSFSGYYQNALLNFLNQYCVLCPFYYLIQDGYVYKVLLSNDTTSYNVTNNTYYNYIYNIPDMTPLNVNNIVSNTAIDYSPVENIISYLPDNYDIDQNFSVVNNYYISTGSAVTGSPIDVNVVSPGVFDVRIINPDDISSTMQNVVNKQIYEDNDINFGDLNFSPKVTIGLNAAKDSVDGIVVATTSSIIASMLGTVPTDWTLLIIMFLAACICVGFGRSIITH